MKKALFQLLVMVLFFTGIWFGLSRIDILGDTTLKKIGEETEEKIGSLLLKQIDLQYPKASRDTLVSAIHAIHEQLCRANGLNPENKALMVYESAIVNAAVLPGKRIIVFTGLLGHTDNADELAGILAHELAHITENHVMERMISEFGTTLLLTLSGMDAGSEVFANILRILTTSAFSREQEREADRKAIEYLSNAEIDPIHLANFLLRISTLENGGKRVPEWVSTHPDARERATIILKKRNKMEASFSPIYEGDWKELIK